MSTRPISHFSSTSFFFNDTATTEIYTLSLHDALPICTALVTGDRVDLVDDDGARLRKRRADRKSTRLNSSHGYISYAVFCLKKKNRKMPLQPLLLSNYNTPHRPSYVA